MNAEVIPLPSEPTSDERLPPQDIHAEMCVLGGMMLSKDAIADVIETVAPEDFYRPAHENIYRAILDLYGRGEPVDPITVNDTLGPKQAQRIGGVYLADCAHAVPTAANAGWYAEIVADKAKRRRLIEAGTRAVQLGYNSTDTDEAVADAQAGILDLGNDRGSDAPDLGALLSTAMDHLEAIQGKGGLVGVPTGITELDQITRGLKPGQLWVIGARPAVGKSVFALDLARSAAIRHQRPVAFFSLEMSSGEITERLLAAQAKVPLHHMQSGRLSDDDWARIARCVGDTAGAPLYIHDSAGITLPEIRAKCRRLSQRGELGLVVVDYLQLMTTGKRVESRQQEVSDLSRQLKLLAKELGVPVVALSQLNRQSEQRHDKKPQLSDLRESGAVEQDADVVILLHREDLNDRESPRAGEADLILAKHRNGPTAVVTVLFQGQYARFVDMADSSRWTPSGAIERGVA